ncbi:MAG: hypothetical protein SFU27_09345 [Thermonemataceae bacterium]|nr:hypothetical protein [Thermonemataceae bacterium]
MQNQTKEIVEGVSKLQIKQMELFLEAIRKVLAQWGKDNFLENFAEVYKVWFEQQNELLKEFYQHLQNNAGINMQNHLLDLQKMQESNINNTWTDLVKDSANKYFNADFFQKNRLDSLEEMWIKLYKTWFEPFMRPFKEFSASGIGGYNMMMEGVKDYLNAFSKNTDKT